MAAWKTQSKAQNAAHLLRGPVDQQSEDGHIEGRKG